MPEPPGAPARRPETARELAIALSRAMWLKYLDRIATPLERYSFEKLASDEQRRWLDIAEIALELLNGNEALANRVARLAEDWNRYGHLLADQPEHLRSMRRAVSFEMQRAAEQLWRESGA